MKINLEELLKLDSKKLDVCICGDISTYLIGEYFTYFDTESNNRITIRDYSYNCINDCRSRSLEIIFIDNVPTLLYQYIGRGDITNIHCLNNEKLDILRDIIMKAYLKDNSLYTIPFLDSKELIEIETYSADMCVIEDNKLYMLPYR